MKLHIVGGPGSGKTTLAKRLSDILGAGVVELDEVGYPRNAGPDWNLEAKLDSVTAIAEQRDWITEGIYLWWTEELFRNADVIVWLDVPWRLALWRIVKRHVIASLRGQNRHRGLRRLWNFVRSARAYYTSAPMRPRAPDDDGAVTRAETKRLLMTSWSPKTIRCRNRHDVQQWIASVSGPGQT